MPEASSRLFKSERQWIWLLCALAAIRLFIFSAAFPFFNNVDEMLHFDLVVKYSHGHIPRGLEEVSPESIRYLKIYALPTREFYERTNFSLPARAQLPETNSPLPEELAFWSREQNYESSQPPIYYALAGAYWRVARAFDAQGSDALYGLRFLNIIVVIALIWLGYKSARMIFPENHFLRFGVAALLAFMPQSEFYSLGNDVLSPLAFGLVFFYLLKWLQSQILTVRMAILFGLAFAATLLIKMTNLPLMIVTAAVVLLKIRRLASEKKLRPALASLAALFFSAALPLAAWMAVSEIRFGDATGAKLKMAFFNWTYKPFGDWWQHPIFSPHGIWTYLFGQMSTFWQGEFWWRHDMMSPQTFGIVYTIASVVFPAIAVAHIFKRQTPWLQREAMGLGAIYFCAALGFYAFLCIIYDFGICVNPSQAFPYFHAGRMIFGMLIPFLFLFVHGLDRLLDRFGTAVKFVALAVIVLLMLAGEIYSARPVFQNPYNWFHFSWHQSV